MARMPSADGGSAAVAQIRDLLGIYFDGLHHSDTARLRQVLHPTALYATVKDGALRRLTMEQYWPVVDDRPSPASQGQSRRDCILDIKLVGPATALATVECAIGAYFYRDLLSLLKLEERWWIMAKVFHAEPTP